MGGGLSWAGLIELNELKNAQVLGELKALLNVVVNSFVVNGNSQSSPLSTEAGP